MEKSEKEIIINAGMIKNEAEPLVKALNIFFAGSEYRAVSEVKETTSLSGHISKDYSVKLKRFAKNDDRKPYEHCWDCELKDKNCKVWDRIQRRPREEHGLGLCIKIGGKGN